MPRNFRTRNTGGGTTTDRILRYNTAAAEARLRRIESTRQSAAVPMQISLPVAARGTELKTFDLKLNAPTGITGAGDLPAVDTMHFAEPGAAFTGMTCLNEVLQGANFNNRIGSKIRLASVNLRFTPSMLSTAAGTVGLIRCMLVYDTQPNGIHPDITDIIASAGAPVSFYSQQNIINMKRFKIIREEFFSLDVADHSGWCVQWYNKINYETDFIQTGTGIGDIAHGALYFIAFRARAHSLLVLSQKFRRVRIRRQPLLSVAHSLLGLTKQRLFAPIIALFYRNFHSMSSLSENRRYAKSSTFGTRWCKSLVAGAEVAL